MENYRKMHKVLTTFTLLHRYLEDFFLKILSNCTIQYRQNLDSFPLNQLIYYKKVEALNGKENENLNGKTIYYRT